MTFVSVREETDRRTDSPPTPGEEGPRAGDARAPAKPSVTGLTAITQRVRDARRARAAAMAKDSEHDTPDPARSRTPWSAGAATPAEVLADIGGGTGKLFGYGFALPVTAVLTHVMYVCQRPSRLGLALAVAGLLVLAVVIPWGAQP